MSLVFVFVLVSGAVLYQPQSEENCAKLRGAFAKHEKVTVIIEGREAPIVHGACIRAEEVGSLIQLLTTIDAAPAS